MSLTFIGKDPTRTRPDHPPVYRTDRETWVVQGWMITDPDALAQIVQPGGETAVEIPDRMIQFLGRRTVTPVTDEEFDELLRRGFAQRPFTSRCAMRTGQRWSCRIWRSGPAAARRPGMAARLVRRAARAREGWQVRPPSTSRIRAAQRLSALVLRASRIRWWRPGGYPGGARSLVSSVVYRGTIRPVR